MKNIFFFLKIKIIKIFIPYLVKYRAFNLLCLLFIFSLSKIKSILRRKLEPIDSIIKYGDLSIYPEEYKVILSGKEIILPKKEFELLLLLASKPKKIFKREKIMSTVWGYDVVVGDRTIDVHIRKLREKIGEKYFKTIKGVGYKFVN